MTKTYFKNIGIIVIILTLLISLFSVESFGATSKVSKPKKAQKVKIQYKSSPKSRGVIYISVSDKRCKTVFIEKKVNNGKYKKLYKGKWRKFKGYDNKVNYGNKYTYRIRMYVKKNKKTYYSKSTVKKITAKKYSPYIDLNFSSISGDIGKMFNLGGSTDSNSKITYISSNSNIATVNSSGVVSLKNEGSCSITAKTSSTSTCVSASKTIKVKVNGKTETFNNNISNFNISLAYTTKEYDGTAKRPKVYIYDNKNRELIKDTDYTTSYSNNTNAGNASVTIKGIGNYTGSVTKTFTITRKSISDAEIVYRTQHEYTGNSITPAVTVVRLKKDVDYTITYMNNIMPGTASIIIKGIGNYDGSVTKNFTIVDNNNTEPSNDEIIPSIQYITIHTDLSGDRYWYRGMHGDAVQCTVAYTYKFNNGVNGAEYDRVRAEVENSPIVWSILNGDGGPNDSKIDSNGMLYIGDDFLNISVKARVEKYNIEKIIRVKDEYKHGIPRVSISNEDFYDFKGSGKIYKPTENGKKVLTLLNEADEYNENDPSTRVNSDYTEIVDTAKNITRGCSTDRDKVRKICQWFTQNVYYMWSDSVPGAGNATGVFKVDPQYNRRAGVCQGQSGLFVVMCRGVGIPAIQMRNNNHAWSAVYIGNQWYLVDTTCFCKDFEPSFDITNIENYDSCIIPPQYNIIGIYDINTNKLVSGHSEYHVKYSHSISNQWL